MAVWLLRDDPRQALAVHQAISPPSPPPPMPPPAPPVARPAPPTKLGRTWWTKERVIQGLRRVWLDLGEAPTASVAYNRLVRFRTERRGGLGQRRYPSIYAVMRHFPRLRAAWEAAVVEQNRWQESWSELEDWYLREGAGILTRQELAADLRRSPDAVHRRLYDLGIHSYQRWGWAVSRVERAAGIPSSTLLRYMRRGELPYLRGSKVLYLDPGDLPGLVEEIDWQTCAAELRAAAERALRERITKTLLGLDWRAGRPHVPHPERQTGRRWLLKGPYPTERPSHICRGQLVRCARPLATRPQAEGRVGVVQAVFYSAVWNRLRERQEPGWFARVEFPKQKRRRDQPLPRTTITLPLEALELVVKEATS